MDDSIVIKPQTLSKGRLWTALIAILLGQFVVAIDLTVLNIALPELTRDLSPSSDQLLWVVDVYSLVLAGFLVATSSLSDRFGRKKMLLAGFLIFGIGSVLVVFINDASQLIAIRAFLGIGGAMIMPITISMIRSIFTDSKERAIAVAAWSAISAIGMAAGPLIGGFLLEHFNWHSAFLVNVPIVGVAFLLGMFAMPEVKLKNPGRFDVLGSVLALAGMVALLWGIKHLAAELAFDVPGAAATLGGLALMALFVFRCLKSPHPIVDLSLFRSRTFSAGVIATITCTFALAVLLYMLAQWLQLVNGDGTLESGIHLIPMSVATLISSLGAAALAMRYQARHVVAAGLGLASVAMLMMFFFQDDLSLTVVIVSTCLVGLGTGALAIGASLIMAETPVEKASSAGSLQEISYDLGNVLGVAILGSLASIIYRSELGTGALRAMGLDGQLINAAKQSFAATTEIGNMLGMPELIQRGADAFNQSLVVTCLAGGIIILVTAIVVWKLIPKGLKITEESNAEVPSDDRSLPASGEGPSVDGGDAGAAQPEPAGGASSANLDDAKMLPGAFPVPAATLSRGGGALVQSAAIAKIIEDAGIGVVNVPLDIATLDRMGEMCNDLGIDVTTAFIVLAKKAVEEGRLPLGLPADAGCSAEDLARIERNVEALDEGRGVMHESDDRMRTWAPEAWADYRSWKSQDEDVHRLVKTLVASIESDGAGAGVGDPRPLKAGETSLWTRRIADDHLLVYRMDGDDLQIIACKSHSTMAAGPL